MTGEAIREKIEREIEGHETAIVELQTTLRVLERIEVVPGAESAASGTIPPDPETDASSDDTEELDDGTKGQIGETTAAAETPAPAPPPPPPPPPAPAPKAAAEPARPPARDSHKRREDHTDDELVQCNTCDYRGTPAQMPGHVKIHPLADGVVFDRATAAERVAAFPGGVTRVAGFLQRELGFGSAGSLHRYLDGKRTPPEPIVTAIAKCLKIAPSELVR